MRQAILIVEDRIHYGSAKGILRSVESVLLEANKSQYNNAPSAENTKIIFCYIAWDADHLEEAEAEFQKIQDELKKERERWLPTRSLPCNVIFMPISLNEEKYSDPETRKRCSEDVLEAIKDKLNEVFPMSSDDTWQVKTLLLLDILLSREDSIDNSILKDTKESVLSLDIFNQWFPVSQNIIPYTRYDTETAPARDRWISEVKPKGVKVHERSSIFGEYTSIDFRKAVYDALGITNRNSGQ